MWYLVGFSNRLSICNKLSFIIKQFCKKYLIFSFFSSAIPHVCFTLFNFMKTFITYPVKIITHLVIIITHLVHIIGDIRGKTCLQAGTEDHNHHHGDQDDDDEDVDEDDETMTMTMPTWVYSRSQRAGDAVAQSARTHVFFLSPCTGHCGYGDDHDLYDALGSRQCCYGDGHDDCDDYGDHDDLYDDNDTCSLHRSCRMLVRHDGVLCLKLGGLKIMISE